MRAGCDGWVSALALASSSERQAPGAELLSATQEQLFPYLAATVFEPQPLAVQHLLLAAALMPTFTAAMVAELSSDPGAGSLLAAMAARSLFVAVRASAGPAPSKASPDSPQRLQEDASQHLAQHLAQHLTPHLAQLLPLLAAVNVAPEPTSRPGCYKTPLNQSV